MNVRWIRTLLHLLTIALGGGAMACLVWAASGSRPVDEAPAVIRRAADRSPTLATPPPLEAFAKFAQRPLRRPLVDPPPPKPKVEKPRTRARRRNRPRQVKSVSIQLLGTALEPGHAAAILMDAKGRIDVKGVGQSLDLTPAGLRVEQIAADHVLLSHQGRSLTIRMPKAGGL